MKSIILKPEEVRGLLDGTRTQLRRLVKPQPKQKETAFNGLGWEYMDYPVINKLNKRLFVLEDKFKNHLLNFSLFSPGDRLWVKEAWRFAYGLSSDGLQIIYKESHDEIGKVVPKKFEHKIPKYAESKWRPPSSMFRWASRLTLEVKRVWVHRIQEILECDMQKEGLNWSYSGFDPDDNGNPDELFKDYWQSLYPGSWERNDWVFAAQVEVAR